MTFPNGAEVSVNPSDAHVGPTGPTAKSYPSRPSDRRGFEIAIICAKTLEADAIDALFDYHWDDEEAPFDKEPGDPNAYSVGVIGRFNVVLAYMPGMGKVNAATVASNCGKSFPGIKLALVVGICGVVPFGPTKEEIILGDIIISTGVIQYDFGRQLPGHFVRKDTLVDVPGRPNLEIRGVLAKLKGLRHRRQLSAKIKGYLDVLRQDQELHAEYPGSTKDRLFKASYRHTDDQRSCEQLGCNGKLVSRSRLSTADATPNPAIHFGLMASGDVVMKSGEDRDRIASAEDIIAFEMEGAGVWDSFPCIIIKGGCDYADSHKSKAWQRYAAATAAACAKAFLGFWIPSVTQGS
jgi:nucleoside phosphorylase